jgi:hypothetical protein
MNLRIHLRTVQWQLAAMIVVAMCMSGCSSEKRVPVFPVTGKVSFEGRAPAGAQIVLHPVNSVESNNVAPTATVERDGSFAISAYELGDGAPNGDYVATIQWYRFSKELGGPGPNVIPAKYTSPRTSPIKVSVNGGPTQVAPILLR